jgi:tRNA threonylcarbamoyladenosine biosynthesis protein TsaB
MLILALDTTSARGSVALARDGRILYEATGDPRQSHGQRLPGELQALLARHGFTIGEVDVYAVASGPGSFTGLRVGLATIQGLALALGKQVIGISVLDVMVDVAVRRLSPGLPTPDLIVPWMDAKRGEVFGALYETLPSSVEVDGVVATGDAWRVVTGPVAVPPEVLLETWTEELATHRVWLIGDGVAVSPTRLADRLGAGSRIIEDLPPLAGVIAEMASTERWIRKAVTPHALRPVYVRRPDVELARDRRRGLVDPRAKS